MPIRVQAPDGSIAEFPDGMKDADIESVMQREYPRSARGVPFAAPGGPSANWDAGNGKAQAATQFGGNQPDFAHNKTFSNIVSEGYGEASQLLGLNGMLDRAVYGGLGQVASLGGMSPNPVSDWLMNASKSGDKVADAIKKWKDDYRARSGQQGFDWFELAGNFASPVNRFLPAANSLPEAMALGGIYGAMQPVEGGDNNQRLANVATGVAGSAVGYGIGKGVEALTSKAPAAPLTTQEIKASSDYASFASKPITLTQQAATAINDKMGQTAIQRALEEAEINQEPHLVAEFQALLASPGSGQTVSTEAADKIRQAFDGLANMASKNSAPNAARGWNARSDALETAIQQTPEINAARNTWAQFRKSEIIDKAIASATEAQGTPAGFGDSAQAIRREFLKLARSKKFASFSAEEQKAITDVANGTLTTNALQQLGKLSPVRGQLTRLLELGGGAYGAKVAGSVGGVLPAIGLAAVGEAARQGSNYATSRAAQLASELVRRGGPAPASTPAPYNDLVSALLQRAARAGAMRAHVDQYATGTPVPWFE